MEAIPLAEGDLRWVFPDLVDESEVREILRQAAGCVEQLAGLLEVRPSWTGGGLEFLRLPGQQAASLFGCVETAEVSLVVELSLPQDAIEQTVKMPPPWLANAGISVRCDAVADCGMHEIETMPESAHSSPVDAARGLLAKATWVLQRGTDEPLDSWRRRDTASGHG